MGWCCTRLQVVDCEGCGCSGRAAAVILVLRAAKRLRQGARRCAVPDGVPCCQGRVWAAEKDQEAAAASCPALVYWASTLSSILETNFCSARGRRVIASSCCSSLETGPCRVRRRVAAETCAAVSSAISASMELGTSKNPWSMSA
jgi:hypothetical protein